MTRKIIIIFFGNFDKILGAATGFKNNSNVIIFIEFFNCFTVRQQS